MFLFAPKTEAVVLVFAAVMGLTFLSTVPPTAGLVAKFFGTGATWRRCSASSCCRTRSAASSAPGSAARSFEATGSYNWVWYIDIVLAVGAALINLPIREARAGAGHGMAAPRRWARA